MISKGLVLALGLLVFLASFLVTRGLSDPSGGFQPSAANDSVAQLSMVFLFSSACAACQDAELPELLESAKMLLSDRAGASGIGFHTLAASTDAIPETGFEYLTRHGRFDEVALGGGWRNHALLRYVWHEYAGAPEVPQVLLLVRELIGPANGFYGVREETLIGRFVGLGEIRRWVYGGAHIRHPAWRAVEAGEGK